MWDRKWVNTYVVSMVKTWGYFMVTLVIQKALVSFGQYAERESNTDNILDLDGFHSIPHGISINQKCFLY